MPFFINYRYTLTTYNAPLLNSIHAQGAIIKVKELKTLYNKLAINIKFITQYIVIYYN